MVSAICPSCNILLVEASSADMADLGAGVNIAAQLGASVVSNSYGGGEDSSVTQESEQYFNHPGTLITASSGDGAYGVNYPASSQYVLAVGGTSLVQSTTAARGWVEGAWSDAGSGCSAFSPKPSWQTDTGCGQRTVADVSAVADPNTGLAVYSTYDGGWIVLGGTSASSPIVAATFALTGQTGQTAQYLYSNPNLLFDVTSGSNGSCGSYLCNAGAGYDGPTGLGTPNATLWFAGAGASSSGGSGSSSGGGGGNPDAGTGGDPDAGGGASSGGGSAGPQITLDSPDDGASIAGNTTIQLVADVSASAGVSDVVLDWSEPSGTLTVDCSAPPSGVTCSASGSTYTFAFAATTGARTWSISATDGNGATTQSETRSLTLVDSNGP
jgi:subtilase family serine protease